MKPIPILLIGILIGTVSAYGSTAFAIHMLTKNTDNIQEKSQELIELTKNRITGVYISTRYEWKIAQYISAIDSIQKIFPTDYKVIIQNINDIIDTKNCNNINLLEGYLESIRTIIDARKYTL